MLKIDHSNIEKLIFENNSIHRLFPSYCLNYFEQWKMGIRFPFLKSLAKQAMLDFLNDLSNHLDLLEKIFKDQVIVEKLHHEIVLNLKVPLDKVEICNKLCEINIFNYFTTWRDDQYLYISFWR